MFEAWLMPQTLLSFSQNALMKCQIFKVTKYLNPWIRTKENFKDIANLEMMTLISDILKFWFQINIFRIVDLLMRSKYLDLKSAKLLDVSRLQQMNVALFFLSWEWSQTKRFDSLMTNLSLNSILSGRPYTR